MRKAYIYMKEGVGKDLTEIETILPYEITLDLPKDTKNEEFEMIIQEVLKEKDLKEKRKEYHKSVGMDSLSENVTLLEIKPIFITKQTRFYKGTYYAHEYDEYLPGKVRKVEYNNGFYHYEVVCESEDHNVLDGIFTEQDRYGNRYDNGYGDYLEVQEKTPWTKTRKDVC